ncbi:MAG: LptF/LptG family permease [Candidatus Omnitrophica bacterium]|nr:LptF/LptG family permease [Candidatus Omnitrophota bacterium]
MKILRNYILKEFAAPLIASILVLTFVMLLGNMVKMADLVINKGVDIVSVSKLFLLLTPYLFSYTLPIATLAAVLLCFGRLSSDNEIIAIRSSGINIFRLIVPILVLGLIMSLVLVVFNDKVIPRAQLASKKAVMRVGVSNPTAALEPGVFIDSFEKYVLFIYQIEGNRFSNIRIYEPQEGKPTRTIVAKEGEFIAIPDKNIVKLKLLDGTSDEPDPNEPNSFYKLNFKTYFMTLNLASATGEVEKKPKHMTIKELMQEIGRLKTKGINPLPLITEINKKLSMAFSCLVFVLIGAPLAIITRRREKSVNFGIAFLIVGAYYLLVIGAEALCLQSNFNPNIAMWAPNVLLGAIGGVLTYKSCVY